MKQFIYLKFTEYQERIHHVLVCGEYYMNDDWIVVTGKVLLRSDPIFFHSINLSDNTVCKELFDKSWEVTEYDDISQIVAQFFEDFI